MHPSYCLLIFVLAVGCFGKDRLADLKEECRKCDPHRVYNSFPKKLTDLARSGTSHTMVDGCAAIETSCDDGFIYNFVYSDGSSSTFRAAQPITIVCQPDGSYHDQLNNKVVDKFFCSTPDDFVASK